MGYTNKTTHYELPQYGATDKPKYLTDFNETMVAIDTQMYTNAQAAATADGKAVSAKDVADGAVSSIGVLDAQINGDPTDPSDTGLAGEVSDIDTDLNTVQSLIGSGTPTTSNQTIIGAINGLEGALAPREDGDNLANSYSTGEQFARGGSVYEALTSLTAGTAFASLTLNTDYKVADTLVEQIADVNALIGDISADLSNKYVFMGYESVASVTGDGVKTRKELLEDLHAGLVTWKNNLDDDDYFELSNLFPGSGALPYKPVQHVLWNKNSTVFNVLSLSIAFDNAIQIIQCNFGSTVDYLASGKSDNNGFTWTDLTSQTVTSGRVYSISVARYKKIS